MEVNDKATVIADGVLKGQHVYVLKILEDGRITVTPLYGCFTFDADELEPGWN